MQALPHPPLLVQRAGPLDKTIRTLRFELQHKAIIDRFGRYAHPYPQRCAILGRSATAEELAFLSGPGSSF